MDRQIAVITIGDERKAFFQMRAGIVEAEIEKLRNRLGLRYALYLPPPVFSSSEAQACLDEIQSRRIACVLIHVPVWGTPSLAAKVARTVRGPAMLLGNRRKDSSSLVCLLACAGMVEQTQQKTVRICGDVEDDAVCDEVCAYVEACLAAQRMSRIKYGAFGGRSIGIGTGVMDPPEWQRLFGCEYDHCDQYEIVRRAALIDSERVQRHREWLESSVQGIEYGGMLTKDSVNRQVRSYLAVKDIVEEREYGFVGIKCQQEMSDHFALQCVGVALLNNGEDADGAKKPVCCACECDGDGALTMKVLSILAGDAPSGLLDIKYFDAEKKMFILANCGSLPLSFASPAGTYLMPHLFGEAGGASVQMVAQAGVVTAARLFRANGQYVLACFEGQAYEVPRETLRETAYCYPHAFLCADIDYDWFFQTMNANHLHLVYGAHARALRYLCAIWGIRYVNYSTPSSGDSFISEN